MKLLGVLVLSVACGRLGFDTPGRGEDGSTSGDDTPTTDGSNIAFLSSFLVVPGSIGGVAAADTRCTDAANAAGLDGPFVAFLSSNGTHAADRLAAFDAEPVLRPRHLLPTLLVAACYAAVDAAIEAVTVSAPLVTQALARVARRNV